MIAIVKYNAGNVRSVQNALSRLGVASKITDDANELREAEKVIFPGVGEASSAMAYLRARGLDVVLRERTKPTLGICLGMQLMCAYSEEGDTECLGIFDVPVKKFQGPERVPHMGWNALEQTFGTLMQGAPEQADVYFVHSYYVPVNAYTTAITEYSEPFSAALRRGPFYATQFHPEKSADVGARILQNFIDL